MALSIELSPEAIMALKNVLAYLEVEWDEKTAQRFSEKLFTAIDKCSRFPNIGEEDFENHQNRAVVIVKQVTLFYKIEKDAILILDLFDTRPPKAFLWKKSRQKKRLMTSLIVF